MLADLGLLIVRIVVGALFSGHGLQKLAGWFGGRGLAGTGQWFESLGLAPRPRVGGTDGDAGGPRRPVLWAGALQPAGDRLHLRGHADGDRPDALAEGAVGDQRRV